MEDLITPSVVFDTQEEMWGYIDTFIPILKENRLDIYEEKKE